MSSATSNSLQLSRGSRLRLAVRVLLVVFLVAAVLVGGVYLWFHAAVRAAMPQLDGTVRVKGLTAPVTVVRDGHGVPSITATKLDDLFFAQGYVTAQDRLWQMDLTRRAVGGEMAEIFPASSAPPQTVSRSTAATRPRQTWVDYDKQQRTMRLRVISERVVQQLSPRDRAFFERS